MEWIAHRAGNGVGRASAAAATDADAIEIDVHRFRGRLEVRHARVLWPLARQFEPWYLLHRDAARPELGDILAALPDDTVVWYDLKGFTGALTRQVLAANRGRAPVTVSCRSWWVLRPARGRSGVRTMKSVNNRWQRWLVARTPLAGSDTGVVINQRLLVGNTLAALRERAGVVVAWGVVDAARARELIAAGVDGLIVDDIALIAAAARHSPDGR